MKIGYRKMRCIALVLAKGGLENVLSVSAIADDAFRPSSVPLDVCHPYFAIPISALRHKPIR